MALIYSISLQMSQLPAEKTFNELNIDAIADNFDGLQVSPEVAFEILRRKCENGTLELIHVKELIKPGLKRFNLDLGPQCPPSIVDEILKTAVGKKCLFKNFSLSFFNCSWECLEAATETLTEAKVVHIRAACLKDKIDDLVLNLRKCVNLESLGLGVAVKEVTLEFILTRFKNLKVLGLCYENDIAGAIVRLRLADHNFTTSLEEFAITRPMKARDARALLAATPTMRSMLLNGASWSFLSALLKKYGSTLREITLYNTNGINMGRLFRQCPQLDLLKMSHCTFERDPFDDQEIPPLKQLTRLTLVQVDLSENQWLALLAMATKLHFLMVENCDDFHFRAALKKTCESRHRFPSLQTLRLYRVDNLALKDLLPMIEESDNPLEYVQVDECDFIGTKEMEEYKQRVQRFGVEVKYDTGYRGSKRVPT